jgi:elongation factor Ts
VTIAGMDDEALFTEHEIARSDLEKRGMSGEKLKKAFQGKMQKIFSEKVLIEQPFVLDSKQTVGQVVKAFSAKCGEKVEIKSFTRTSI